MSPFEQQQRNEHPVMVFVLVASIVLALLFLLVKVTSGSGQGGSNSDLQALTPSGGEQVAVLEAAAPVLTAEIPAMAAAPVEVAVEAPAVVEPAPVRDLSPTAAPPIVSASSYSIVERSCGALAFGWNEHQRLAPASLTKIVTALVVANSGIDLNKMVDIQVSGSQMRSQGSSVMGIEPGQRYSVRDLLYGLMLPSGNDAAVALATELGNGDANRFVGMMNEQAAALGMTDTHFSNPHGLDSRTLYSSTYDMAMAGRAALDVPLLWDISNARSWTTSSGLSFRNGNKLMSSYPDVFGVKIGFTNAAKQTIVAGAERDGRQVIVSLFGSDDRYRDAAALLDWTFEHVPSRC